MSCYFDAIPSQTLLFDFSTDAMVLAEQEMVEEDKKRDIELQRVRTPNNTAVPFTPGSSCCDKKISGRLVATSGQRAVR